MDSPGFTIDLATAWVDEKIKFNSLAYPMNSPAVSANASALPGP